MNKSLIGIILLLFAFNLTDGVCFGLTPARENAQINVYSDDTGVYFIVTDPQGRRAGYDPVTLQYVEEFPASFAASGEIREEVNDMFNSGGMMNLIPGTYIIEIFGGAGMTPYSLNIRITRPVAGAGPTGIDIKTLNATPEQIAAIKANFTDFYYKGIIDKGYTTKYKITYTSDQTKPAATAERPVEPSTLKQDIALSRKMGWIDSDGMMNSLLRKAEAIESSIARGNKTAALNQLNALINEIDAQKGKHIFSYEEYYTKRGNELVKQPPETGQAVKLLLDDAQYLINLLSAEN